MNVVNKHRLALATVRTCFTGSHLRPTGLVEHLAPKAVSFAVTSTQNTVIYKFEYPSLRHLRQQPLYAFTHPLLPSFHEAYGPDVGLVRLTQPNEDAVKVHPLPVDFFIHSCETYGNMDGDVDRDPVEISMFGCKGLERKSGPYVAKCFKSEYHLFES